MLNLKEPNLMHNDYNKLQQRHFPFFGCNDSKSHMYTEIITFTSDVIHNVLESPWCPWGPEAQDLFCYLCLFCEACGGCGVTTYAHLVRLTSFVFFFFVVLFVSTKGISTASSPKTFLGLFWCQFLSAQKRWIFGNWCYISRPKS